MEIDSEVSVPPQHTAQPLFDFRHMAHGPRGYKCSNKRKLDDYEEQVAADQLETPMQTGEEPVPKMPKRRKVNNVVGVGSASGRPWKVPGERAGSFKNPLLSTSWEKKMKDKAERDAFKVVKRESIAAHKEKLAKVKKQRQDARAKKEANKQKSNVTQTISSNATLRKMMKSKKQRKLLQKADTLAK